MPPPSRISGISFAGFVGVDVVEAPGSAHAQGGPRPGREFKTPFRNHGGLDRRNQGLMPIERAVFSNCGRISAISSAGPQHSKL